jgi:hypothetical protein
MADDLVVVKQVSRVLNPLDWVAVRKAKLMATPVIAREFARGTS